MKNIKNFSKLILLLLVGIFAMPSFSQSAAVDLGLPSGIKWAAHNVGANKPEERGGYYAWGETEEKNNYE